MNPLVVVLSIGVAASVGIAILTAFYTPNRGTEIIERLAQIDTAFELREAELAVPFTQRVIQPMLEAIGRPLTRKASPEQVATVNLKLNIAGNPVSAGGFLALRVTLSISLLSVGLGTGVLMAWDPLVLIMFSMVLAIAGGIGPGIWLDGRVRKVKAQILEAMPDTLDLLTISAEAGLSFDAAMARVTEKFPGPLSTELLRVMSEIRLGRPRREALTAFSERLEIDDLSSFVQAIVQSEQMGSGLAPTLRIQSEEMRRRRRQRAEEKGAKAPVKMLLPMVGCIFPTLFIVLLGPAILEVTGPK